MKRHEDPSITAMIHNLYKHALVILCVRYYTFHENVCYLYSPQLHPSKKCVCYKIMWRCKERKSSAHSVHETILHIRYFVMFLLRYFSKRAFLFKSDTCLLSVDVECNPVNNNNCFILYIQLFLLFKELSPPIYIIILYPKEIIFVLFY